MGGEVPHRLIPPGCLADGGMVPERQLKGTWLYPPIGVALATVRIKEIGMYIDRRQNTFAQYNASHPIMELCLAAERRPGMRISRRWWEQTALDILWVRSAHVAADIGEEKGAEESEGEIDYDMEGWKEGEWI